MANAIAAGVNSSGGEATLISSEDASVDNLTSADVIALGKKLAE